MKAEAFTKSTKDLGSALQFESEQKRRKHFNGSIALTPDGQKVRSGTSSDSAKRKFKVLDLINTKTNLSSCKYQQNASKTVATNKYNL